MNYKELKAARLAKVQEMENIVETRAEGMTEEDLTAVNSIKEEITSLDRQIDAINEIRSLATKHSTPEKSKESKQEEIREAFASYVRGDIDQKTYEKRASVITNGADIVPEDFYRQLLETINEYGVISNKAKHITTQDSGQITIPMVNDTGNSGIWTQELGAAAKADFTTSHLNMDAWKATTGIQVSTELIEDAFFDVSGYIASSLGIRLARTLEDAYIKGDGASKPEGILKNAGTVNVTTANAGAVKVSDLLSMIHSIPPSQRIGAEFRVSDDVLGSLLTETDSTGRPLLQPLSESTQADDIKYQIGGYPLGVNYELEQIATGNHVGIFGNLGNYWIRDVRGVTIKRDDYSDMNIDAVNFYATVRVDGKVVNPNTCFAMLEVA